ncbi:MAG: hypothetical protein IT359_07550 [Gemmatimonadaceae bacterium]|nr:hypothetical protein [Gemmatimonadaceae bacterium]
MTAEHHDHGAALSCRMHEGVHDALEVASDEDVGEGAEEGAERAVIARRARELARIDLVGAAGDRDGADLREVGFRDRRARGVA